MANARDFSLGLDRFYEREVEGGVVELIQKIGIDLLTRVILKSPVDSGRFRGNWTVTIGSPSDATTEATDPSGNATINAGTTVITGLDEARAIYIANNLPYAEALESGHSGQAPAGVVAVSISEIEAGLSRL